MFTLTIKTDNEAFQPDAGPELARILRGLADDLDAGSGNITAAPLFDANGNRVGAVTLTEEG